jgi:hypothetical protein
MEHKKIIMQLKRSTEIFCLVSMHLFMSRTHQDQLMKVMTKSGKDKHHLLAKQKK